MKIKRYIVLLILVVLNACTCAMALKAAIGVGAYDALAQTFSIFLNIKVGTIGFFLNCLCVLGEFILLKKEFRIEHLLQIPVCLILGFVVNYVLYEFMSFTITNYLYRVILLIFAYLFMATVCGFILALDVVTFPLEGFCIAFAKKYKLNFRIIRQSIDVICIILSLTMTYFFNLNLIIREGTLIGMVLFAPMMNYVMNKAHCLFLKQGLIKL